MKACRLYRPSLYKSRTVLEDRCASLACAGDLGRLAGAYPLLSRCAVRLEGSYRGKEAPPLCWRYTIGVPVMLLGEHRCERVLLSLPAELCAPVSEEQLRACPLHLDICFDAFNAALGAVNRCDVQYTARICLYLTV